MAAPFSIIKTFILLSTLCDVLPNSLVQEVENVVANGDDQRIRTSATQRQGFITSRDLRITLGRNVTGSNARSRGFMNDHSVTSFIRAIAAAAALQNPPKRIAVVEPRWYTTFYNRKEAKITWDDTRRQCNRMMREAGVQDAQHFLDLDVMFFPQYRDNHWTLSMICPQNMESATMDSMSRGKPREAFSRDFVPIFLEAILDVVYDPGEWVNTSEEFASAQQDNLRDCGLVACLNALAVSTDKAPSSVQLLGNIGVIRQSIAMVLMEGGFVAGTLEL